MKAQESVMHRIVTLLSVNSRWLRFIGLALISIAYVCVSVRLITPSYMVNDNIQIMDYAIHGLPIDYVGVLFTNLLHIAYATAPDVPWYGFSLYALHMLSVFLWLNMLWRVFHPRWLAALLSIIFLGFYLSFLIYLDYTSTSVMLCMSSLAWACLDVVEHRPGHLRFLGPGFVFMLGMLARPQAGLGAIVYAIPLAFLAALWRLRSGELKAEARHLALIALMFFTPAVVNMLGDAAYRHYSMTAQQSGFDAFNKVRGRLQGLPREREFAIINDPPLLRSIKWSRDDAQNFFNWRFLDERTFNTAALQGILDNIPPPQDRLASIFKGFVSRLVLGPGQLLLLCSPPFFLMALRRRRRLGSTGLLMPFYGILIGTLMSVYMAFRERTEMPFVVGFGLACLILGGALAETEKQEPDDHHNLLMIAACILGLAGLYFSLTALESDYAITSKRAAATKNMLETLNQDFAGSVVMLEPDGGLQLESLNPLEIISLRFDVINLGWNTFSPRFYQEIAPLGIDHGYQLLDALINNKNAYLFGNLWWASVTMNEIPNRPSRKLKLVVSREFSRGHSLFSYEEDGNH
jgi:hypothetical protein